MPEHACTYNLALAVFLEGWYHYRGRKTLGESRMHSYASCFYPSQQFTFIWGEWPQPDDLPF